MAVWAIVTGIFSIVASERLRREMPGETLLGVAGVIAVVLGLALAMIPGIELLAMLFLAGLFGLAFGADMILLSLRFRRSGTPAAFFAEERLVSAASEKSELGGARRAPAWGAVLAGAVVAVAAFFVIDTLGAALGFSVSERITGENLATSSAVWMTLSVVTALFFGGWFMARQIGAETTPQACMHGTLLWGVVFVGLLYFATTGIVTGLSSVMGVPEPSIESYDPLDWDEDGLPLSLSMVLANPLTKTAAWWAFGGMVASLLATIGGSAAGRRAAVYRVVAHRTPRRETAGLFSNKPLSV